MGFNLAFKGLNIARNTCCVIDRIPLPIIYTHNGDGTLQKHVAVV